MRNTEFGIAVAGPLCGCRKQSAAAGSDPLPEAGKLYLLYVSVFEKDHPPTNRFAVSYGKAFTLHLHL